MLKLYTNPISPNAKRINILAAELGLELEAQTVDFAAGDNRAPDFLAKNPNGKVPVVEIDGRALWESPAILYEIASRYPQSGLVPEDLAERSEMLRWMFWNASHFQPAILAVAFERWIKPELLGQEGDAARAEEHTRHFERFAKVLDGRLEGRRWLLGEQFTIADIAVGTGVGAAGPAQLSLEPYADLTAWFGRLAERPSWNA